MFKAKFKTAYLQREIAMDVAVIGASPLVVGEMVTFTPTDSSNPDSIASAVSAEAATHIIAQSDMTMEYGHVPVENRDYKYVDTVAVTASSLTSGSPTKMVAVFAITDKNDLIVKDMA